MGIISLDVAPSGGTLSNVVTMPAAIHGSPLISDSENIYLNQGSGGDTIGWYRYDIGGTASAIIVPEQKSSKSVDNVIRDIRSTFDLSMSDFAKIMRTTRKTAYNWIAANKVAKQITVDRLFSLSILTKNWNEAGFPNAKNDLRRPTLDGRSVYDLLSDKKLNHELIMFVGRRLALATEVPAKISDPFS